MWAVSAPNAQRSFGADVISRIQASVDSGLDKLQSAIVDQINGMLVQLKQKAGRTEDIRRLAVAGNTVMSHLFCGLFRGVSVWHLYAFVSVWGKL